MYPVGLGAKRVTGLIKQRVRACRKWSRLRERDWSRPARGAKPWSNRSHAGQFSERETEFDSPCPFAALTETVMRSSKTPSSKVNATVTVNWLPKLADWFPE